MQVLLLGIQHMYVYVGYLRFRQYLAETSQLSRKGKQGNFSTRTPYVKYLNHIHRGPPGPSGPRRATTPEGHWAYQAPRPPGLGLSGPTYLPACLPACLPAYLQTYKYIHNYIYAFTCFLCFFEWTNIHLNLSMAGPVALGRGSPPWAWWAWWPSMDVIDVFNI